MVTGAMGKQAAHFLDVLLKGAVWPAPWAELSVAPSLSLGCFVI